MDEDLEQFERNELVAEVKKLRAGIRKHRDSTGHELCWHHPQLWELLPEKVHPALVPAWPQFLRGCLRYREPLDAQLPNAPRMTDEFEGCQKASSLAQKHSETVCGLQTELCHRRDALTKCEKTSA